jgi:TIR domain
MPDIFLSYSREDQVVARRYVKALEREGLSVWWDVTLKAGEVYDKVTEQAGRHDSRSAFGRTTSFTFKGRNEDLRKFCRPAGSDGLECR